MTPKALAQLRRDVTNAKHHLAFLERMAAIPPAGRPVGILLVSDEMLRVARAQIANMERLLAEHTPQLGLFEERR